MPQPQVCMGANMQCSFGAAPSTLMVLPIKLVLSCNKPSATIMDHVPLLNIMPFGMCQSMANPMVAAATAAALGVLTPMPCIPMTSAPWTLTGPSTVMIKNNPTLNQGGMLMCNWGGVINITNPGVQTVLVS